MYKTILVVDDEESICQSLQGILTDEGYEVRTVGSSEEALKAIEEDAPDLVLLDIWLPGMDGLECLKVIKTDFPQVQVIMMSGHGTIETAVKAIKLGAFDFIEKPFQGETLLKRVREALVLDARQRSRQARRAEAQARLALLSPREREVLDRVAAGQYNKVIAAELGISLSTVEIHRKRVMEKLEAASLSDLIQTLALAKDGE